MCAIPLQLFTKPQNHNQNELNNKQRHFLIISFSFYLFILFQFLYFLHLYTFYTFIIVLWFVPLLMTDKSKNYKGPTLDLTKLKNLPEIKEFLKNLQCGDIQLSRPIPYGITLYGQTKVGKTSACHCLSLSPLKGSKIGGQVKFITTTNNYKTAQIGNQGNSKTQIPNFFQLRMSENGKPIVLIDTPGYGDTYGVYRILSNGFYHYRLYSKVQNMKFLITFDTINLKNTAQSIIKTIQHFTNSFKYYKNKEQRDEIWSAAAFLITKVQNGQNQIKDIKDKFTNLADTLKTQLNEEDDKLFRQFLRYIVKENKIFIIKHAIQNQSPDFTGLLQKINLNIKCWWKRQVINGIVNMQPINFAIGKKLNTCLSGDYSQKSKAQFADLMIYMNYNSNYYLNKAKGSIKNFLKQIGQDAVKAPNSHKFLNLMKEFVDENYNFNKEHKQRRQIQEKRLFEYVAHNPQNSSPTQANKLHSDKQKQAYLIKKFKVLQFVQKIKKQINQNEDNQKISLLEFASQRIYELIKLLNTVRFMVSDSKDIIYKYGYLMHRIFEESKIFILLIQGEENKLYKESLFNTDVSKDNNFKPFQITRNLKDLMGAGNEQGFSLEKIKEKYILDFDFSNKDIVLSQSLIDFFTSLKVTDNKIAQNIIQLVSRYCNQIIIKKQKNNYSIKNTEAKRLIRRLYVCRQQCDCLIIESKNQGNKKQTQSLIMVLRSLTIQIGYLLQQIGCISTAIQVYETIYFVQKVLNLYQEIIKNQPQNIEKRIDYAIYASQHYRQNLAIQILQTSFQVATNYQDLEEVKKKLINIKLKSKSQELGLSYGKQLNNDNFYKPFNYALQSSIGNIIEEDVIQSQVNSEETPK